MDTIKPIEKIAERYHLSKESAKYYVGRIQKAFRVEKPPHKLIVDFIEAQEFKNLPLAEKVALMMRESNIWVHELTTEPVPDAVEGEEIPEKKGRGTNRKTRDPNREKSPNPKLSHTAHAKPNVCPHGVPNNKICADCEFETFIKLTQE